MKRFLFFIACLICKLCFAQTNLVLRPDSTFGNDAFTFDYYSNTNYGDEDRLDITAWTEQGTAYISRAYLNFDLSSIPIGSTIDSAFLSLYHNYTDSNYNGVHSGLNNSYIQRVTSTWQENLITWNNQASTTSTNEIFLPATITGTEDFLNMNVSGMVQDMIDYPASSFGFMMRLQTEVPYRDLIFATCEHADSAIHPKLEIYYTEPVGINSPYKNNFKLALHPNPLTTTSVLKITNKSLENNIAIYNCIGELLYCFNKFKEESFPVGKINFNAGIYFLQVKNQSGENRSLKFVVN